MAANPYQGETSIILPDGREVTGVLTLRALAAIEAATGYQVPFLARLPEEGVKAEFFPAIVPVIWGARLRDEPQLTLDQCEADCEQLAPGYLLGIAQELLIRMFLAPAAAEKKSTGDAAPAADLTGTGE
jgi:hypothetical protein